jgi:aspartate aminotransferase
MLTEYTARRAWLLAALREIPRLSCNEPEGAFYAFPSVRECLGNEVKTSADFSFRLLTEEHTVVTDGAAFGAEGYLRISYATSMKQLVEGVTRIRRFVERLNT